MFSALKTSLVAAVVVATFLIPAPSYADAQKAVQVQDCSTTDNLICIKDVFVKRKSDSKYVRAVLTGKQIPVDQISNGGLRLRGVKQEYRTPGIFYEGQSNDRIIPTVEFFPAITVTCPIEECSPAREVIGVFVSPSAEGLPWQDRLVTSPFRSDSKYCSLGSEKALCVRNLNFGLPLDIKIQLQIPTDYIISFIHGLAADFSYSVTPSTIAKYSLLTFEFSPVEHSGMLNSTWGTDSDGNEGGDYLIDSTALWFFGKNDMWSESIGPCAGSGPYGVVNNAVEMGEPQWNSEESTLSVRLRAPHVNSRNEVAKGYFGAFVSKKMAECLWNLDVSSKSSSLLSVAYSESGKTDVLTAVSQYRNEIFYLETTGFHYSSPIIKLKMQEVPKTNVKKQTILCVKGKTIKRISNINPKCPAGYKAK